ncbi:MAG: hypothetical protein KGK16_10915 [Bradyrhizobium sp.]|nr:hypothetical protein [Bradyrhizobium sp.]
MARTLMNRLPSADAACAFAETDRWSETDMVGTTLGGALVQSMRHRVLEQNGVLERSRMRS